jgi:hypothetical protein
MRRVSLIPTLFSMVVVVLCLPLSKAVAAPFDVDLFSRTIENFKVGDRQRVFGKLEFVGGIEFTSPNAHVGAISGLALIDGRSQIVAVTDTGFWFTAKIERDQKGRPMALKYGRMAPLLDANGQAFKYKWISDAESIIVENGEALVSFERDNRVLRYRLDLEKFATLPKRLALNIGVESLRQNKGLETLVKAPANGALKGAIIVISERSMSSNKQIRGAIIEGPEKGRFTVKRKGKYDITDGDFLPNGDLLLLERRFNMANGIGMRIRRIKAGKIRPGASLKGKKLIKADISYQIDNMEGLSVTTDGEGQVYLSLISDNNHSLLQRNLYLEFKLLP